MPRRLSIIEGCEVMLEDGTPGLVRSVQTVPGNSEVTVEVVTFTKLDICFANESDLTCTKQHDFKNTRYQRCKASLTWRQYVTACV